MKFSLTWDPMGVKFSKRYSSYNYDSFFLTKLYLNIPCGSPHKRTLPIGILNLNLKKRLLSLWPMGK